MIATTSVGEAIITVTADTRQADASLTQLGQSTQQKMGAAQVQVGKALTAAITLPLIAISVQGVKTAAEFEKSMNTMGAVAGVPGPEIEKLRKLAIKLGADTIFSANEAAQAQLELAKAGISTADIMGGALKNALDLAAAGDLELSQAALVAANAMNTFGLSGKESQRAVDALAGAANASSADVGDLALALSQGGLAARNAGLSIEETSAVLAAFADNGLRGSDAGTSLKTMLLNLVPVTKKQKETMRELDISFINANGSFKSITEIAEILQTKLGGLSDAQRTTTLETIFGSDAMRAATVLTREGADGLAEYIKATSDTGTAAEVAAAKMKGLPGAIERFKGSVETAMLAVGNVLAPMITKAADALGKLANAFTELPESAQKTLIIIGGIAAVLGPALIIFGSMAKAVVALKLAFGGGAIAASITGVGTAATGATGGLTGMGAALARGGPLLLGLGAAGAALALFVTQTDTGKKAFALFKEDMAELGEELKVVGGKIKETAESVGIGISTTEEKVGRLSPVAATLVKAWEEANSAIASGFIKTSTITDEAHQKVIAAANLTKETVVKTANEQATEQLAALTHFAEGSFVITQDQITHATNLINGEKESAIATAESRTKAILEKIQALKDQGLTVTQEMVTALIAEDQRLLASSISLMEENKTKRLELLELLKLESGQISVETASNIISESARTRDETIKAAEAQTRQIIAEAVKLREAGVIDAETATARIEEAKRAERETIAAAQRGHTGVVAEVSSMGAEAAASVNAKTGEIKGFWERTWDSILGKSKTTTDAIGSAINDLPPVKSIDIKVLDNASATLRHIIDTLNAITSKTVTVTTIRKDTGNIGSVPARHQGGPIMHLGGAVEKMHFGGIKRDERLALLQTGEFVIRRSAAQALGRNALNELNSATPQARVGGHTFNLSFTLPFVLDPTNPMAVTKTVEWISDQLIQLEGSKA